EAMSSDVFGDDARHDELQKIIGAARFGAAAAHLESAERMTTDDSAGAGAVDVNISSANLGLGALDVGRTPREESGSERIIGAVGDLERFIEVAHFDHTEHRPENLFASNLGLRCDVGENRRRNEKAFRRDVRSLKSEPRFLFASVDVFE